MLDTAIAEPATITVDNEEANLVIDEAIRAWSGRELVSSTEAIDALLDIRQAISRPQPN